MCGCDRWVDPSRQCKAAWVQECKAASKAWTLATMLTREECYATWSGVQAGISDGDNPHLWWKWCSKSRILMKAGILGNGFQLGKQQQSLRLCNFQSPPTLGSILYIPPVWEKFEVHWVPRHIGSKQNKRITFSTSSVHRLRTDGSHSPSRSSRIIISVNKNSRWADLSRLTHFSVFDCELCTSWTSFWW